MTAATQCFSQDFVGVAGRLDQLLSQALTDPRYSTHIVRAREQIGPADGTGRSIVNRRGEESLRDIGKECDLQLPIEEWRRAFTTRPCHPNPLR